jgi:hypothetical protein
LDLDAKTRAAVVLLLAGLMVTGFYPQLLIRYLAPLWP